MRNFRNEGDESGWFEDIKAMGYVIKCNNWTWRVTQRDLESNTEFGSVRYWCYSLNTRGIGGTIDKRLSVVLLTLRDLSDPSASQQTDLSIICVSRG